MNNNDFFHMASDAICATTPVSTDVVYTESQKDAIWLELKLLEEMFKQDRSLIFKNYK